MSSKKCSTAEKQMSLSLPDYLGGLLAGVDEAGRGPWAGPVVAAAVILDDARPIVGLRDSKKLSAKRRTQLASMIKEHALAYSIAQASVVEIERINILQATMLAMQRAVVGLRLTPRLVLIDGNRTPQISVPALAIVGGDAKVAAISAASILAKEYRDAWCLQVDLALPEYGFAKHKGYGTALHLAAIEKYGVSAYHRRNFKPVKCILEKSQMDFNTGSVDQKNFDLG